MQMVVTSGQLDRIASTLAASAGLVPMLTATCLAAAGASATKARHASTG